MGRITVFTSERCFHSRRAKRALESHDIPYEEICISKYPEKRRDMMSLSSRLNTPQVFFNTRHVGSTDEVIELLRKWDEDKRQHRTPLERYKAEIAAMPDPMDIKFKIPDYPPISKEKSLRILPVQRFVSAPDKTRKSVVEITETLKSIMPSNDRAYNLTVYKNCFTGTEAVQALQKHYGISESQAIDFGQRLQNEQLLDHVVGDHKFDNVVHYFYRLRCYQTPDVLNSYCTWKRKVDPDSIRLTHKLDDMIKNIEMSDIDEEGRVDFSKAKDHGTYPTFEEAVCELQNVDLLQMDDNTKKAFGLNVFNLMVRYGYMKLGVPLTDSDRVTFLNGVKINVGGHHFSFMEMITMFLMGKTKLSIGKQDPRNEVCVQKAEARLHFGHTAAARSCPASNLFTAKDIDNELTYAAESYCEDDHNISIDVKKREVHLSHFFNWYRADFAESVNQLPKRLLPYLRATKKQSLERLLSRGGNIKIVWKEYDWSLNASHWDDFDPKSLKANERTVKTIFMPRSQAGKTKPIGPNTMVSQ